MINPIASPRRMAALFALMAAVTALAEPLVIAHRGASGHRPEHTLESYRLAIEMGADFIEPDLMSTRDGHLVARHEPEISATTDVAKRPEFASRRRAALIDGVEVTGWFTSDFTLAELKTLRAVQPHPDRSSEFDGLYEVPTLEEIIALARDAAVTRGRPVGIYPETKHPSWHCAQGLPLEPALLTALEAAGWTSRESPVFIQSFEAGNLRWLRERTQIRLVQLIGRGAIGPEGIPGPLPTLRMASDRPLYPIETPADLSQSGERRVKAFEEIAAYADAVGPWKRWIIGEKSVEGVQRATPASDFVQRAHEAGLAVHAWTFRNESQYLLADYEGDPANEYRAFAGLGVDGVFSDYPDTAVAALHKTYQNWAPKPK